MYIAYLLRSAKESFKIYLIRKKFKKNNKHNQISIGDGNNSNSIFVGKRSYGIINYFDFHDGCKLIIGNYCSIAKNVFFCMGGEHDYRKISTFPFGAKINHVSSSISKGDIIIEDDVWIGVNVTILSGVRIGKGSIIGAGSVVTKSIPAYSIVCGSPAKVVKMRFSNEIIDEVNKIDFNKISFDDYCKFQNYFETELKVENAKSIIEEILKNYE